MAIHIVTDSSADLPKEILDEYNIRMVPLCLELDEKIYPDGTFAGKEFYDLMDQRSELPKTSAASPGAFAEVFQGLPAGDQIISLILSSKLSATYQSAVLGVEMSGRDVRLVDSKLATLGLGILAVYAAEMVKEGLGIEEIISNLNYRIDRLRVLVYIDTPKNIVKSGRIGKLAGSLVNMLNLKLLLTNNDGQLEFLSKIRGKKLVLQKLVEFIEKYGEDLGDKIVGISHGDSLAEALELKKIIEEKFNPRRIIINYMGSCIGTHAGRGGLTISF